MSLQVTPLNTIQEWFRRRKKPTQSQFWNTFFSFRHKLDKIAMVDLNTELQTIINEIGGGSFIVVSGNGTTANGNKVDLGGNLVEDVNLVGSGSQNIQISKINSFKSKVNKFSVIGLKKYGNSLEAIQDGLSIGDFYRTDLTPEIEVIAIVKGAFRVIVEVTEARNVVGFCLNIDEVFDVWVDWGEGEGFTSDNGTGDGNGIFGHTYSTPGIKEINVYTEDFSRFTGFSPYSPYNTPLSQLAKIIQLPDFDLLTNHSSTSFCFFGAEYQPGAPADKNSMRLNAANAFGDNGFPYNIDYLNFSYNELSYFYFLDPTVTSNTIFLTGNNLPESEVNRILIFFQNNNAYLAYLNLIGNAAPTGLGLAAKNYLISQGATVETD